ncbi:hypothetical protein ACG7TL_004738 [Trametes sanguinea]
MMAPAFRRTQHSVTYTNVFTFRPALMAASNVTVDDSSSLIAYDPPDAWQSLSGSAAQAYANATMHGTAVSGASARFAFNGTGVWFYGAKKPEYGSFIMLVDNEVSGYANASAASPEFGQLLGGVSGLQDGQHVVSIMNGGTGPMDLDAILFESVDQQQPKAIAHASAAQTSASGSQTAAPSGSAGRISATPYVALVSDFTNALKLILLQKRGRTPGSGSSSLAPLAANAQPAAVPAAVTASPNTVAESSTDTVASTSSVQPSATPNASSPNASQPERSGTPESSSSSNSHHGLPKGAIIGIAIGCVVVLLLIAAFIFILLRRRRRSIRRRRHQTALPSPTLPLQDPDTEFGYFFRGQGSMSEKRDQYLGRSDSRSTQFSSGSGETLRGYGEPYREKDVTELPTPLPPQPACMGTNGYSTNNAQYNGARLDDASDITDMYSRTECFQRNSGGRYGEEWAAIPARESPSYRGDSGAVETCKGGVGESKDRLAATSRWDQRGRITSSDCTRVSRHVTDEEGVVATVGVGASGQLGAHRKLDVEAEADRRVLPRFDAFREEDRGGRGEAREEEGQGSVTDAGVALATGGNTIWASFWGFYFRKFFFDFVKGTVRNPGGVQPANSDALFVDIIVKAPVIQILSMLLGFVYLALDYPAPFLKNTAIHRSFPIRIVLLLLQTFFAILYYQVRLYARIRIAKGTNGALYSFIAACCYIRAQMRGEFMPEAKDNKGRGGKA